MKEIGIFMKNSILAFAMHLLIVFLGIVGLIIFVWTSPSMGKYTTSILSRIIIIIMFMGMYLYAGYILDIKQKRWLDYFVGCLIILIGGYLWVNSFNEAGGVLHKVGEDIKYKWIPYNLYCTPSLFAYLLIEPSESRIVIDICPIPLITIGMKIKRYKKKKKSHEGS